MFMDIIDLIPLENSGMSCFTALVLFFMFAGWGSYFWWDRREHVCLGNRVEEVDNKTDLLFSKIDSANGDISEMRSHIAGIHEAVEWIKKYMENKS